MDAGLLLNVGEESIRGLTDADDTDMDADGLLFGAVKGFGDLTDGGEGDGLGDSIDHSFKLRSKQIQNEAFMLASPNFLIPRMF